MKPIPIAAYRFEGGNIGSFMCVIFEIYMESCYSPLPPHLLSFSPATRFHYTQTGRRCQCSASAHAAIVNDGKQDLSTKLPLKNVISQQHSTQGRSK